MTSLVTVGEDATLEADVDLHGWWLEGDQLVVGELRIGAGARLGTRTLLAPGAAIGAGAEVEPGSFVIGAVPEGERWAGSPATRIGDAGDGLAADRPGTAGAPRASGERCSSSGWRCKRCSR